MLVCGGGADHSPATVDATEASFLPASERAGSAYDGSSSTNTTNWLRVCSNSILCVAAWQYLLPLHAFALLIELYGSRV